MGGPMESDLGKLLPVSRKHLMITWTLNWQLGHVINFLEKMISTTENWLTINVP